MARAIEPGQEFEVEYGNGKRTTVVALSLRKKAELGRLMKTIQSSRDASNFEHIIQLVSGVKPDATEEFFDTIDETMAMEIVSATMTLTEAEQKKSESQPLSDAVNCARAAEPDASSCTTTQVVSQK